MTCILIEKFEDQGESISSSQSKANEETRAE